MSGIGKITENIIKIIKRTSDKKVIFMLPYIVHDYKYFSINANLVSQFGTTTL